MIPPSIDIGLLRSYALVCRIGSLSQAAIQLDRTQSALSMQMQRLEDLAGRKLLRRTGRGVVPTADGEAFLSSVTRMLAIGDDAIERMRQPVPKDLVRIGLPEEMALRLMPQAIAHLRASASTIDLDITTENTAVLEPLWRQGRLDVMIATPSGVSGDALASWNVRLQWICGHGFSRRADAPMPLVVFAEPCTWRRRMFQLLTDVGFDYRVVFTSPGIAAIQAAVESGLGVGLLTPDAIRLETMRPAPSEFALPEPVIVQYGLYAATKGPMASKLVIDALLASLPSSNVERA